MNIIFASERIRSMAMTKKAIINALIMILCIVCGVKSRLMTSYLFGPPFADGT
jgi:hypothetical protein